MRSLKSTHRAYRLDLLRRLRAERKVSFARARLIRELLAVITEFKDEKSEFLGIKPKLPFKIELEGLPILCQDGSEFKPLKPI